MASRNFEKYYVYRMINVQTEKVTETRNVTFVGNMFGEVYDVENYLAYQAKHERYVSEEELFDKGLNTFKVEDAQYDVIEKFLLELKVKGYETKVIDVHYSRKLRMDNAGENKKFEEIIKLKNLKFISSIPLSTVRNSTVCWSENLQQFMGECELC